MANERLRESLLHHDITAEHAATALGVDAKTVERWVTKGRTPYPKHRFALAKLLDEQENYLWPEVAPRRQYADVEAVYPNRADFMEAMPPRELFKAATSIDMAGLSLNLLCQQYSDNDILKLLESGTVIRCLFLDPEGTHIREREAEEGHKPGVLTSLTELNMHTLARVQHKVSDRCPGSLHIRTYDQPVRFNITIVDKRLCIIQPYLPSSRGVESPTLVARRSAQPGIFDTFTQVFESLWAAGKETPTS